MASKTTLASLVAFTASAAAQQSLLTIPFYGYDSQAIVASVINVANSATTMSLACPADEPDDECGLGEDQTLTIGPSIYHLVYSDPGLTATQSCSPADATSAICVLSASGTDANVQGVSTDTWDATDIEVITVTVTAGAEKLGASAAAGASSTGPASTQASATGTSTSESVILVSGTVSSTLTSGAKTSGAGTNSGASSSGSRTGSASAASTTTNAAVANGVAGPMLVAAGAGVGLIGWLL